MSVADQITRIKNEVTSQTDLIEQIKAALAGKVGGGSSSGGGNVETCTLTCSGDAYVKSASVYNDGAISYIQSSENVVCGTIIRIGCLNTGTNFTVSGLTQLHRGGGDNNYFLVNEGVTTATIYGETNEPM